MAGFEVIVRPVIFPDIRPAPRPAVVPAADDPEKGIATIRGSSARTISLPWSFSVSASQSRPVEKHREVDVVRVKQKGGGDGGGEGRSARSVRSGDVSEDNYIDLEVAHRITMQEGDGSTRPYRYANVQPSDNVEILNRNQTRKSGL
jgi:hypothetical protein